MKKTLTIILAVLLLFTAAACGGQQAAAEPVQTDDMANLLPAIGLSIDTGEGMNSVLISYAKEFAAQKGYELLVKDAGANAEQQKKDIEALQAEGAMSLIVCPADIDSLQDVLDNCQTDGIRIVNLSEPVNGKVDCLIMPDFSAVGEKAAKLAKEAAKDGGLPESKVYLLEGAADDFNMQWLHKGFADTAAAQKVSVAGTSHFSREKQKELSGFSTDKLAGANIVFAQSSDMALKLCELCADRENKPFIITVGGGKAVLEKVKNKEIYASIVFGPKEIAQNAVEQAVKLAEDENYEPPEYIGLQIGVASESSVDSYIAQKAEYAEAIAK